MAQRPAWSLTDQSSVIQKEFSFEWNGGFAVSQKRKNIHNLHEAIRREGCAAVLEISSKSEDEFGCRLSAFHLKLNGYFLENVFQSSKVYEMGGPYPDLLTVEPRDAKRDERHTTSGKLKSFSFQGTEWELIPRTAFYDYIYAVAARDTIGKKKLEKLSEYMWFTDIEFNPKKSVNCQARSAAFLKYIVINRRWDVLERDGRDIFLSVHTAVLEDTKDDKVG